MKIIPPKYDFCAKELFRNEVVRKQFLSDVLGIPPERIRTTRLMNTFLWKRSEKQKLGILDVLIELNDDARISIEIQLRPSRDWDKRQLFYLAKTYTADLNSGEDYSGLKRCVGICILDFNLTDRPKYHSVYHLTDEDGYRYSDMLEIHTLELKKKLTGQDPMDDWIRLFNAESREDLRMIETTNPGVREAIREVMEMSLGKRLRAHYEARLKYMRDQKSIAAYEEYARQQAWEKGQREGMESGLREGMETGLREGRETGLREGRETGLREGRQAGMQAGIEKAIDFLVQDSMQEGKTRQQIIDKLIRGFSLTNEEAAQYVDKHTTPPQADL